MKINNYDPKKIKLNKHELEIEESFGDAISVDIGNIENINKAIKAKRKDKCISLRLNKQDLDSLKTKADKIGIPYQTLVSILIHQFTTDQIKVIL